MKKYLLASFLFGMLLLQNCTNSTDETPTPIVITVEDFTVTIDENQPNGTVIGSVIATVTEGELTFSIIDQNPPNAIAISEGGQLTINDETVFDFEVNPQITASVQVVSGDKSETLTVTINLNDVAEGSDGLTFNDFSTSITEGPANGTEIGVLSASSVNGTVSFTLNEQSPEGAIAVDATTGAITVANATLFVFDTNPTITASVEVTDGIETGTIAVTINLQKSFNIWTGQKIAFSKASGTDPTLEANQDRITNNVWITRANRGQIFNIRVESNSDKNNSPTGTEWAIGTTANIQSLAFAPLRQTIRPNTSSIVGVDLVLHLITDDVYIDIKFTQWDSGRQGGNGGFAYERSTEP